MKIYGTLLALCVFHRNVWGTTAFVVQAPKSLTVQGRQTSEALFSSYMDSLGGGTESNDDMASRGSYEDSLSSSDLAAKPNSLPPPPEPSGPSASEAKKIWDKSSPVLVQGGSLKTWSFASPAVQRVQVVLSTEGRPLEADVDLWQGPDNTPQKMRIYNEDGSLRPFSVVMETPRGPNTVSIRNIAQLEFPLTAFVAGDTDISSGPLAMAKSNEMGTPQTIQGGALKTYAFDPTVESVQVLLSTDGRPLNARVELLQGPNNIKQVVELYTEDGMDRPFFAVLESPGSGNVVRIVNTATMEYPLIAWVAPYMVGSPESGWEPVIGGDSRGGLTLR